MSIQVPEKALPSEQARQQVHVAVVGGGITGLASAWYLQKFAAENGVDISYTLLESADRWGGKILTEHVDVNNSPFVIEAGPDSFLTQKPWGLQLALELGLDERILDTNDHMRQVFVLKNGRSVPLPDGVFMIIPTKIMPFVLSPLISLPGKMRMGLDLLIPPKRDGKDETIAEFVNRRLGREAVDRLAEPLMSGIYNAEADRQSVLATFPRFRALEEKYGNLIRGMLQSRKSRPATSPSAGKKRATFVSLTDGTTELVEALLARLTGNLRLNTPVRSIAHNGQGYRLQLDSGEVLEADQVILTTPAFVTADLLSDISPDTSPLLEQIRYVSTGTISLAFRKDTIQNPLQGFGLVIPQSENRPINAVTWTSTKFNHRAPEDHVLLRVFFGGSRRPEMMEKTDEELLKIVRTELAELMGIKAEPVVYRIFRWFRSNPQYDVGHLEHVDLIESTLPENLFVTGSAYRGIGIPDCVRQAKETTQRIVELITSA